MDQLNNKLESRFKITDGWDTVCMTIRETYVFFWSVRDKSFLSQNIISSYTSFWLVLIHDINLIVTKCKSYVTSL